MRRILFATLVLAGLFCASSQASPILSGTFSINGNITVSNFGTNGCASAGGCITWTDPPNTSANRADIAAGATLTGVFATITGFSGNDQASISNLTNPPDVVDGAGYAPQLFMSFCATTACVPAVTTTLLSNFIAAGIYSSGSCGTLPALIGQTCTPNGSLFSFVNNPGGGPGGQANATWVINGVTNDGASTWTSIFTSQFNVPYQSVLQSLSTNGFVTNTYSATFTVTQNSGVPEAGTMSLLGLGLVLVSTLARRKARKI